MSKSTYVYVTYIRTTPEKLWAALTDAEFSKEYWFGCRSESAWTPGSPWKLVSGSGEIFDAGEIVEAERPRRLVIRWQQEKKPELKAEGPSLCTMEIEQSGSASTISPASLTEPSPCTIFHDDPAVHRLSQCTPNQYCFMNSASVSADHSFSGVVRM